MITEKAVDALSIREPLNAALEKIQHIKLKAKGGWRDGDDGEVWDYTTVDDMDAAYHLITEAMQELSFAKERLHKKIVDHFE